MEFPLGKLLKYCERHNYKLVRIYETLGETRIHCRAIVLDKADNTFYLYYDPSNKRVKKKCYICKLSYNEHITMAHTSACSSRVDQFYSPRGWRNVTKDNIKKKSSLNVRAMEQILAAYR